jgi:hypothetical protein
VRDANANGYGFANGNSNGYGYSYTDGNAYGYSNSNSDANTDANCNSNSYSYGNSDLNTYSNCGKAYADAETASNDAAAASVVRIGKWTSSGGNSRGRPSRVLRLSVDRPAGERGGGVAAGRSMMWKAPDPTRVEPVLAVAAYGVPRDSALHLVHWPFEDHGLDRRALQSYRETAGTRPHSLANFEKPKFFKIL